MNNLVKLNAVAPGNTSKPVHINPFYVMMLEQGVKRGDRDITMIAMSTGQQLDVFGDIDLVLKKLGMMQ